MNRLVCCIKSRWISIKKCTIFLSSALVALCFSHLAVAGDPYQSPLFLANSVKPIMMLNMSKDHQLFFKLYDDYGDITGITNGVANGIPDGTPDITYINAYTYYGYFDSDKCYTYSTTNKRFVPVSYTANHYCNTNPATGQWSGNFLNWASMTRIDAIRKMLYGGYRSTDSTGSTVLERALLPNDAHSFAKYYSASDINKLTPFSNNGGAADIKNRGITICNTTSVATRSTSTTDNLSTSTSPPVLRVLRGNYSLWASHEGFQCVWTDEEDTGDNGNNQSISGIAAYSVQPPTSAVLGPTSGSKSEYVARVEVCSNSSLLQAPAGMPNENRENCLAYQGGSKPVGLLQRYASLMNFGLMTGSYTLNKSGGVLRKSASSITNEIDANGKFIVPGDKYSIIGTLNNLRVYGYNYNTGHYFEDGTTNLDNCKWVLYGFNDGSCTNWGNPQAEIYLESLRYLAGKTSPKFSFTGTEKLSTLQSLSSWADPISQGVDGNYCAPLNVLQFNSSTTSYDNDQLTSTYNDIFTGNNAIVDATKTIGASESIHGNSYFIGKVGSSGDQLCTAKTITDLSQVEGICPHAPRLGGGYNLAGLAYLARNQGIGTDREKVKTFGVALAPALPQITIKVPGSSNKEITILPACRVDEGSDDKRANCAIVDFKVVGHTVTNSTVTGNLYVNWEDSEQGGDYDQDMWGVIQYTVTSSQVTISTKVAAQSTFPPMGFGYVIGGTVSDGFYVQSGVNYFIYGDMCTVTNPCTCLAGDNSANAGDWKGSCNSDFNSWRTRTFSIGTSTPKFLKEPLYYAAKWGGYATTPSTATLTPTQIAATTPETYFFASDAKKLEESLEKAFREAAGTVASSATVAANTTRIDTTTMAYQARFDSGTWSGQVIAYPFTTSGTVSNTPTWNTDTTVTFSTRGSVYTYAGATNLPAIQVNADSPTNTPTLFAALKQTGETDTHAQNRMRWLLGSHPSGLRVRTKYMGDIVNADPAYAGPSSQRYQTLPVEYGSTSYRKYVQDKALASRTRALFVGANDGKLHALNAETGQELFSYIPRGVYSKLIPLTNTNYTHQYTVDGPLYVGDYYADADTNGLDGTWKTIVVGGLGAGGKGIYALDVTDALTSVGEPKVIFDYSADDATTPTSIKNDLGYIMSRPLLVPTMNGNWSVVFANGVNSVNGIAKLIAIDVENPTTIKVIDTKAKFTSTNDNGLTAVALLPDGNGITSYAYGGDLLGKMWKFDLTSTSIGSWKVAYGSSGTPAPLVTVTNSTSQIQPITAAPTLGYNSIKKAGSGANAKDSVVVYFGTGKYYELTDSSDKTQNTIYAIADTGTALTMNSNRTNFYKKEISSSSTATKRTISNDTGTSWWKDNNGWYLDLPASGGGGTGTERVITKPLLIYDRIILNTFIPAAYQCGYGGSSWLMELRAVGDKYEDHSILGNYANTLLSMPVLGDMIPLMTGEKITLLGSPMGDKDNPPSLLTVDGTLPGGTRGRMSWRQLK